MDFMTVLTNILAVVETAALIGGLIYVTRAIREKNDVDVRKAMFIRGAIYFAVYFVLNIMRNFY